MSSTSRDVLYIYLPYKLCSQSLTTSAFTKSTDSHLYPSFYLSHPFRTLIPYGSDAYADRTCLMCGLVVRSTFPASILCSSWYIFALYSVILHHLTSPIPSLLLNPNSTPSTFETLSHVPLTVIYSIICNICNKPYV